MYSEQNHSPIPVPQESLPQGATPPVGSVADTAYAWLSLLFAFLFCQFTPVAQRPLGGFLLIVALFITGFIVMRAKKQKMTPICVLSAVSALIIGSSLLLTNAVFLMKWALAYCLAAYCYFLYAAFGNRVEKGFSDYVYIDFIKALFLLPFCSLGAIFTAFANRSTRKASWLLLKVVIGIGIAVIPTSIVLVLLSYDSGFMDILRDIFSFDFSNVVRTFRSLFLTLPLAMYGFGLYASSEKKTLHDKMSADACRRGLDKVKILPQLTAVIAVLPLLFLYVVFFISQWKYYVSGFTGVLPDNFSYAQYARRGFFELCAVAVINLLLITAIVFFIKRRNGRATFVSKMVATLFCLCTLVLISTAVAKLVMYIDYYGLTQKRIYALWLIVLIGIVFLLIAIGQYLPKLKTVAVCLTVSVVLFAGLAVCNVNALCAAYNADRYLNGSLESIDTYEMERLGDSAIPSLVRVATHMDAEKDPALKRAVDNILRQKQEALEEEEFSLFSFSLPSAMAKAALKDYQPAPLW